MGFYGVDASQCQLVTALDGKVVSRLRNEPKALCSWACSLPVDAVVGIEATGRYHRAALQALDEAGIVSYLLNPMKVHRYNQFVKPKVKTDAWDAKMIARYLEREYDLLTPFKMPSPDLQELKDLLSYRETLLEKKVALRQSLGEQTFRLDSEALMRQAFESMISEVDSKIREICRSYPLYRRLLTIDGVGPMGAAALTWLFESHEFRDSDQAVSFVGLDVSVRESGKYKGHSKLTKRGPAFVRTFLFNGVNSLRNIPELQPLFEHHAAKKLSPTAVNLVVARKIVRIAYAFRKKPEAFFERKNLLPHLT